MQKLCSENSILSVGQRQVRIGIFDSGVGGLNVLGACMQRLPHALFYYFGDNSHAPYGNRAPAEIGRYVGKALSRFARLHVSAVVLACNTATAVCAEQMRARFSFPVIGMEPAIAPAARVCRNVLVLATPRTAESERLRRLISRFPQCRFTVCALPALAGAIERRFSDGEKLTISDHLPPGSYDGVVLGCTHYAFYRREIADFYGVPVFDGVQGTANRLEQVLRLQKEGAFCGTDDHLRSKQNPNKCFMKKYRKRQNRGVIFLGNDKKINKTVFLTNICFTKK